MIHTRITNWSINQLGDLSGKRYLITGANSGIGLATAHHLRRANADVLLACRSTAKGQDAMTLLGKVPSTGSMHLIPMDLGSMASIRNAADLIRSAVDGLDGIVNNAGIMGTPQQSTVDGFELQFGTNHLGHFLLNYLLFDLVQTRAGRIVPVSSMVHHMAPGINFADPMFRRDYSAGAVYAQSKLANLMYGLELARRLHAAGSAVKSICAHPGYTATHLQTTGPTGIQRHIWRLLNVFALTPEVGSISEVLAVAGDQAVNGAYYGPTQFGNTRGPVGDCRISDAAQNVENAKRLWTLTEELLDVRWEILPAVSSTAAK
jgi:NAD(P)-dependent dehydrogenase (short-subunit alcohol dehydrogenase family)